MNSALPQRIGWLISVSALLVTSQADPPDAGAAPEVYQGWPFNASEAARRQDEAAKALGVPKELTLDLADKAPMKFILIPAGKFMMGSTKKGYGSGHQLNVRYGNKEGIFDNELPQHEVTLTKPFYMGTYLVTQGAVLPCSPMTRSM